MTDLKYIDAEEFRKRLMGYDTDDLFDDQEGAELTFDGAKILGEGEAIRKYGLADISDEDIAKADEGGGELDGFTLPFTISTASVDRDNDTIKVAGWKLKDYRKNPVVLWAHNPTELPVARSSKTFIDRAKEALRSETEFPAAELHPFGNMVGRLFKHRFMNATSVGFRSLKAQVNEEREGPFPIDFMQQELLEFSAVPIPANPEALVEARGIGIDTAPLTTWAEKILDGEGGLYLPRHLLEETWKHSKAAQPRATFYIERDPGGAPVITVEEKAPTTTPTATVADVADLDSLHDDDDTASKSDNTANDDEADDLDTVDESVQSGLTPDEAGEVIRGLVRDALAPFKGDS